MCVWAALKGKVDLKLLPHELTFMFAYGIGGDGEHLKALFALFFYLANTLTHTYICT